MNTDPVVIADSSDTEFRESMTHVYCYCDENLALCGTDITGWQEAEDDEDTECVVCLDLEDQPCERCGE